MVKTLQLDRYVTFVGLLCLVSTQARSASSSWPIEGCTRQADILTCTGTIPPQVPQGIKEVTMLEINEIQIRKILTDHLFCHGSWSAIVTVSIIESHATPAINNLYNNMFECLGNMTTLKLMLQNLYTALPERTFAGLDRVTTLDMSDCQHLSPACFFIGLKDSEILPNLSSLVLHNMNTINDKTTIFTKEMIQTLSGSRNITHLDMSNMRLSSDIGESFTHELCQTLQVLNISGVKLIFSPNYNRGNISPCYSLKTFDISGGINEQHVTTVTDLSIVNENRELTYDNSPDTLFFKNITTLYISNVAAIVYGKYVYIYNSMVNFSILNNLKHLYLSNNKLKHMDCVLVSESIRLETLDLLQNDMEYLTPRFFQQRMITSLRKLDISQNMLWRMESNQTELEAMFTNLIHLEILHLSDNNFSKIPNGIFAKNRNLHHLDISNNKLTQVNFGMEHLIHLRYFDISENSFVHLDSNTIRVFNHIYSVQTNMSSDHLKVNLHNNPLRCYMCSTLEFAEWMSTTPIIDKSHERYMCESETRANKPFDRDVVSEIHTICDRSMILRRTVLLATLIPAAAITLLVITIRYAAELIRKKRNDAHVEKIRRKIENNQYKFKYPVFLSYSSFDQDIVLNHLYKDLQHRLRVFCRTDRELVCIGDRHFRAGRWIFDEVSRCLEMSALLVVVMSNNYCRSDWCIDEVHQAYHHHKQMLLIFIEDVAEEDMHPILMDHFRKRVRVKFCNNANGDYEIQPEWDTVCSSIIGILP